MGEIELIKEAGVVGAGGAGFPTHVKLNAKVDVVIANGAECEPLLRVDQQLMAERAPEIMKGLEIAMRITNAKEGVIALKGKYKSAVHAFEKEIEKSKDKRVRMHILGNFYPAGDEQVLVYEVTKRIVPEGGIPLMVSVVVQNVNTLINIANAIEGKPVISKYVTVSGAVKNPSTFEVPIGISIKELIEKAGGAAVNPYRIIVGGPMMGYVGNEEEPVTKTTGGVIVLPAEHPLILKKMRDISRNAKLTQAACIRCTLCTQACPRNLLGHNIEPDRVMKSVAFGLSRDVSSITNAFLCVECGVCTYFACPMELDPMKINHEIKMQLSKAGVKNPHKRTDLHVNEFRETRKVPLSRLIARLGLSEYDVPAPMRGKIEAKKVRIPLKMHIGSPALPTVKVGDFVKEGDVIGRITDGLGANVHASISGKVTEVSGHITIEV